MDWEQYRGYHAKLNNLCVRNEWAIIEDFFFNLADELSGPNIARMIRSTNLTAYTGRISTLLSKGTRKALEMAAKAIYFEYDIDNNWSSGLFIHSSYQPEFKMDDDWTSDWIESLIGPDLPLFTQIYRLYGGFHSENDNELGTTFYLIARTVVAFGKAVETLPDSGLAICTGYHDQGTVTRVREGRL